jgi:CheY-like chemotaxis protein
MLPYDGYAATVEIRRLTGGTRRVPIIAMTAEAMEALRRWVPGAALPEIRTAGA